MKSLVRTILALAVLAGFSTALTAQPARFVEGTHYVELAEPVRTSNPDQIQVTEVFWYGCSHCYSFEPLVEDWEQNLPEDVVFVRSPGMWNAMMQTHARVYYTSVDLGVWEDVHNDIYDAIQLRGNLLQTQEQARAFFADRGVDPEAFDNAWNSFNVTSQVNRASNRMRDYGIRATPTMVVNGKYRITVNQAVPTHADMLEVVNYLIDQERSSS